MTRQFARTASDLEAQRAELLARSAALRTRIAADLRCARPALDWLEKVRAGAELASAHRGLALTALVALASLALRRPRRLLALGLRIAALTQVARQLQPLVRVLRRWVVGGRHTP